MTQFNEPPYRTERQVMPMPTSDKINVVYLYADQDQEW